MCGMGKKEQMMTFQKKSLLEVCLWTNPDAWALQKIWIWEKCKTETKPKQPPRTTSFQGGPETANNIVVQLHVAFHFKGDAFC